MDFASKIQSRSGRWYTVVRNCDSFVINRILRRETGWKQAFPGDSWFQKRERNAGRKCKEGILNDEIKLKIFKQILSKFYAMICYSKSKNTLNANILVR